MQVPPLVAQGRYLLAQVLAYVPCTIVTLSQVDLRQVA